MPGSPLYATMHQIAYPSLTRQGTNRGHLSTAAGCYFCRLPTSPQQQCTSLGFNPQLYSVPRCRLFTRNTLETLLPCGLAQLLWIERSEGRSPHKHPPSRASEADRGWHLSGDHHRLDGSHTLTPNRLIRYLYRVFYRFGVLEQVVAFTGVVDVDGDDDSLELSEPAKRGRTRDPHAKICSWN